MSIIIKDAESSLLMCRETIVLQSVEKNNLECIAGWLVPKAACMPDCAGLTLSGICYFFLPLLRLLWPFADMKLLCIWGKKINCGLPHKKMLRLKIWLHKFNFKFK